MRADESRVPTSMIVWLAVALFSLYTPLTARSQAAGRNVYILVDNGVSPLIDPGDRVVMMMGNTPTISLQNDTAPNIVYVTWNSHDGLTSYVQTGDIVHWLHPDGAGNLAEYTNSIQFQSEPLNPCANKNGASPLGPCTITISDGARYYTCKYCGDPRIVIRSSTPTPASVIERDTQTEERLASAILGINKKDTELAKDFPDVNFGRDLQVKLGTISAQETKASDLLHALASQLNGLSTQGPGKPGEPARNERRLKLASTLDVDLICAAAATGGPPTLSVVDWGGVLESSSVDWVNDGDLGDGWSIAANVRARYAGGKTGDFCRSAMQTEDTSYAGPCDIRANPTTLNFEVTVASGKCQSAKPWVCTSGNTGNACIQAR